MRTYRCDSGFCPDFCARAEAPYVTRSSTWRTYLLPEFGRKEVRCSCNGAHRVMKSSGKTRELVGFVTFQPTEPKLCGGIGAGGYEILHWV